MRDYEQLLLTYATDYQEFATSTRPSAVNEFFDPAPFQERAFEMRQEFDYAGVEGRLLSSSYAPGPDHPQHAPMLRELRRIFEAYAVERPGRIRIQDAIVFRPAELGAAQNRNDTIMLPDC